MRLVLLICSKQTHHEPSAKKLRLLEDHAQIMARPMQHCMQRIAQVSL
jgi:hypothetical protein